MEWCWRGSDSGGACRCTVALMHGRTGVGAAAALAAHVHLLQRDDVCINAAELLDDAGQLVAPLTVPLQWKQQQQRHPTTASQRRSRRRRVGGGASPFCPPLGFETVSMIWSPAEA